jgi:hypothetical protein
VFGEGGILELSRMLHPGLSDDELPGVVLVGVYIDESEDDETGVFTLAGWLASKPTGWQDIVPAWRDMIAAAPHVITEFHMVDIAGRREEFSDEHGWTQPERDALVKRAVDILADKTLSGGLTGFGVSILRRELDWQTATSYEVYKVAYQVLMTLVCGTFAAFKDYDFVFDEKEKVRKHVNEFFWQAKEELNANPQFRNMLNGVSFEPSCKFPELQAADFIAYERQKRHADRVRGVNRHRMSWKRLCERPHYFKVLDRRFVDRIHAAAEAAGRTENLGAFHLIADDVD